jgi:predicted amidohydrolase YtcJ
MGVTTPARVERRGRGPESNRRAAPDRILTGGVVWTGLPSDRAPHAGWAVSICGDRIGAVGPADQVLATRNARTVIIDVRGGAILPGFVDAHVHLQSGGLDLFRVDLRGARSEHAFELRVRDRAHLLPPGSWVLGGGWDERSWGGALPHRSWLDRAAPDHPVFLLRTDMHIGVANGEALRRAGLDVESPDPDGGRLDRDPETGELTGVLRESALELVSAVVPPPAKAERAAALRAAMQHALRHGVTQVHDMGALQSADESWASLETLRELASAGQVPIRISAAVPLSERHRLEAMVAEFGGGDDRLRWGSVKAFVDGSVGAGTAWFLEDYAQTPGWRGAPVVELEGLRDGLLEATAMGLQPIVHAIGDAAVTWITGAYEEILQRFPGRDLRLRMEHVQHLVPDLLHRLAHPGIVCSMQPAQLLDDAPRARERLGPRREAWSFALRSLLDAGVRPAFGSDWTVSALDPRVVLDAAVLRRAPGGEASGGSWIPTECISVAEALQALTLDGARAAFFDGETGSLEAGKRADLAVLDASPFDRCEADGFSGIGVRATYVDGVPAWEEDPGGSKDRPGASAPRAMPVMDGGRVIR